MNDNSFDSEAPSEDSFDDEKDTNHQTDKEKTKNVSDDEKHSISSNDLNLITSISNTLITLIEKNKKLPDYKEMLKIQSKLIFSAKTIPSISIKDYLIRIKNYSKVEKSTLILALILIDHPCKNADLMVTYYNIHRLLFGAILVAIKFNEDKNYENSFYAEIAGVKPKELKLIELEFLELIQFKLFVRFSEYEQYRIHLEEPNKE